MSEENKSLTTAQKALALRDALALNDYDEAYHQLYSIVDPEFEKLEPWHLLERVSKLESELAQFKSLCELGEKVLAHVEMEAGKMELSEWVRIEVKLKNEYEAKKKQI